MDIYDLMSLYYPRRKIIISRIRDLDQSNREEAKHKAAEHEAHGYLPKMTEEDFISTVDIVIPLTWIDNEADKVISGIDKLRRIVDGIGEVKYENSVSKLSTEPVLTFNWFPYTESMAALNLYSDFIKKLVHKICYDEELLTP